MRFTAFGTDTEEGRAKERLRRIYPTAGAYVLAKATSMLTLFVSIPLILHYLGQESFYKWVTTIMQLLEN